MADNNVSRIYTFLSTMGDWQAKADYTPDGIITKDEFKSFIRANFEGQSDSDLNAMINAFWKDADFNRGNGRIGNTGLTNTHALDKNEQNAINKKVGAYGALETYLKELQAKVNSDQNLKKYFDIKDWINNVRNALTSELNELLAQGDIKGVEQKIKEIAPRIQREVTVNLYAKNILKTVENKLCGFNYNNSDLKEILSNYTNTSTTTDIEAMVAQIQQIIEKYLATAGLEVTSNVDKSKQMSEDELNGFIQDQNEEDSLNDLQKAIAGTNFVDTGLGQLEQIAEKVFPNFKLEGDSRSVFQSALKDVLDGMKDEFINGLKVKDFNSINAKIAEIDWTTKFSDEDKKNVYTQIFKTKMNSWLDGFINEITGKAEKPENGITSDTKDFVNFPVAIASIFSRAMEFIKAQYAIKLSDTAAAKVRNAIEADGEKFIEGKLADPSYDVNKLEAELIAYLEKISKDKVDKIINTPANITITDKTEQAITAMDQAGITNGKTAFYFRVLDNGTVEMVNWTTNIGGIFNDGDNTKNTTMCGWFETARKKLEETYADEITQMGLSERDKANLFNMVMFLTLSDNNVVPTMYNDTAVGTVMRALADNYTKILKSVNTSEGALKLLRKYPDCSLVAGRTLTTDTSKEKYTYDVSGTMTKTMEEFYKDDSTGYGDDEVYIGSLQQVSFYGVENKYYHINTGNTQDSKALNDAFDVMINSYVSNYKDVLSVGKIVHLFAQAQDTARTKLLETKGIASANNSQIYGYSECGRTNNSKKDFVDADTYYGGDRWSVQSILLEVMYEMERLIQQELLLS